MKFRFPALLGLLAAVLLLASAADAQTLYVRNRPFPNRVNIAGTMYVPAEELLRALRMDWTAQPDGSLVVKAGRGQGAPLVAESFLLKCEDRSVIVDGRNRAGVIWVPLRPVAETLGFSVLNTPETGVLDVVAGRPYSDADREAEAQIEAQRTEREQAIQAAWDKRREQIVAERKAREEAAAAAAAAAQAETAGEAGTAPAAGGGEGTFPPEMAAKPTEKKPAAETKPAASEEKPAAEEKPVATEEKPAAEEKPKKPDPEALLIVVSPTAVPDYFTGKVNITARVQNNGYADATGVTAYVTLKGPDGSVWSQQTLRQDRVKVDDAWELQTSYTHLAGNAMPRGVPTVEVKLDYTKK